jgi:hypothetical protein
MGTKREKLNSLFYLVVIVLVIALMMHFTKNNNESQNRYFEENGRYTICKVIEYGAHTITGSSAYTRISYKVNDLEYQVESDYNVPFMDGPKPGELFMGIYLTNEPEKCAFLFDYPIKDSTDYKYCIEKFKNNPPKLK